MISRIFTNEFLQICIISVSADNSLCCIFAYSKLVKLLKARVSPVNFTNFLMEFVAGFCYLESLSDDMEGVEEEIPRNETEPRPGKPIYDVYGNTNPGGAATNLVGNDFFDEVDPRVVTKLFLCPLCFCKLAYRKDAENHVFVHHKIDAATFQDLNLNFHFMEV